MNALIIDQLNKLVKQIKAEELNALLDNNPKEAEIHSYRLKQMRKVLGTILSLGFEITSPDDLVGISGIGKGTLARVKEILETGHLAELDKKYEPEKQAKINSIWQLLNVIGIGDQLARRLVLEKGITNVVELRDAVDRGDIKVNYQVKLGLKYYESLQQKIPRAEITQTEKYLEKKASQVDRNLHLMICGSYRRGQQISGDIDVMLFHPDVKYVRQIYQADKYNLPHYLELFVQLLQNEGFLLESLSYSMMKYMGFCKYNKYPVRRIDIRFMPSGSLPAAMLYFTGPKQLNEEMRKRAKRMGMLLNEYGLFIVDSQGIRIPLPVHSEKDIFEELGMEYLTPMQRESYNLGKK